VEMSYVSQKIVRAPTKFDLWKGVENCWWSLPQYR
jgi:hypothetical protein